jgi:hypothetical protein
MRPSFVNLPKPFLCAEIDEETPLDSIYAIRNAEYDGAAAVYCNFLALDRKYLNREDLSKIFSSTTLPVLVMNYRRGDNRMPAITDEERAESFLLAVEAGASAVDVFGDIFDPSPMQLSRKPGTVERQRRLIKDIHDRGGEVMLSCHTLVPMKTEEVLAQAREVIETRRPDMIKIVPQAATEDDLLEALKTTSVLRRELTIPFLHVVMGKYTRIHRVTAPMFGSACCLCVPSYKKGANTEQPLLRATRQVWNNFVWQPVVRNNEEGKNESGTT